MVRPPLASTAKWSLRPRGQSVVADRRRVPRESKVDAELRARIAALEARVEELRGELNDQRKAFLEALATVPGARGSMPPPRR